MTSWPRSSGISQGLTVRYSKGGCGSTDGEKLGGLLSAGKDMGKEAESDATASPFLPHSTAIETPRQLDKHTEGRQLFGFVVQGSTNHSFKSLSHNSLSCTQDIKITIECLCAMKIHYTNDLPL